MPFLLLAYPFLEFWSLLEFSARTTALATITYILVMIIVGYWLLQLAGRSALLTVGRFPSAAALRGQLFAGEISLAFGAVFMYFFALPCARSWGELPRAGVEIIR